MKRIVAFFFCLLALPAAADVLINSGGGGSDGYSKDRYYDGGSRRTFSGQSGIYATERRSNSYFRYAIPVTPGIVEVTLRLRESCVTCPTRAFSVKAEGQMVIPQVTIPVNTEGDRTFSVQSNGRLNLVFTAIKGEAFVNAIEVRQLSASAPTVNFSASPSTVSTGGSSTISWTTAGATSCTGSDGWSGAKPLNGSEASAPLSAATTFTLACAGQGGTTTTRSATVAVSAPPMPIVSLSATPSGITSGGSTTLSWTASNATDCTASGAWSGSKGTTGSQSIGGLTTSSTYTLTCSGAGGTASATAAVAITAPLLAPTVTLSANPSNVASGGTSLLSWTTTNASSCTGTGAWSGTKTTSGSQSVGPLTAGASYGLHCIGNGGTASASTTVAVTNPQPTVSLTASPFAVVSGGTSTLSWTSTNATSCTASGAWSGTMATAGTKSTGPLTSTGTFSLSCTGAAGGTASQSTVVTVSAGPPTITLSANPVSVVSGSSAMITWSSTNASSCTASDGWSGSRPLSGSVTTGTLSATSNYTLTCTGSGGTVSKSTTVTVKPTGSTYGLEWPGDGTVRRMLYWHNPFPIYDATYLFRVYPRKKPVPQYPNGYYTTFFWGNDGTFIWDSGGNANTYYGAHPYPIPAPNGPGQWEISVASNDFVTGTEVVWDRWYTQAFRAWRESPSITHHEFYWDLPDTSKVIRHTINDPAWAARNPPTPAIVIGQAPNLDGASWGGYPGWEEFNGVIRGIQLYSGLLSLNDILAEIATPQSTAAGSNLIWYLNLNPRPSDVTDKKGTGTPHNPSWDGTTALEWVQ